MSGKSVGGACMFQNEARAGLASSSRCSTRPKPTEMTVMTASAPKVPPNTRPLGCCSASSSAMKKVLSPISEKKMSSRAWMKPSLQEERRSWVLQLHRARSMHAEALGLVATPGQASPDQRAAGAQRRLPTAALAAQLTGRGRPPQCPG